MRFGRLFSVLTLVGLLAAAPAPAGPARVQTSHSVSAGASAVRIVREGDRRHVEHVLPGRSAIAYARSVQELRSALHSHLAQLAEASQGEASSRVEVLSDHLRWLRRMGDLDSDGGDDFAAVRLGGGAAVEGVAGADGRRLWTRRIGAYSWAEAVPLRNGGDGVLAVAERFRRVGRGTYEVSIKITAIGGGGSVRWQQVFDGEVSFTDAGYQVRNVVFPLGIARINGPGDDVALVTVDYDADDRAVGPVSVHAGAATVAVDVVDGRTGASQRVAVVPSPVTIPAVELVDDLDGDGLWDLVAAPKLDEATHVLAMSGNDGVPLWHRETAIDWLWYARGAGDTDGDGRTDLLLLSFDGRSWGGNVHLLSGADGAIRWRRSGEVAGGIRDIDGDGGADVRVMSFLSGRTTDGFRYRAYTSSGRLLYDRSHTLVPHRRAQLSMAFGGVWGDLDGDRRLDMAHELEVRGGKQVRRERGAIASRDGRKLFDGPVRWPLDAPLAGRGDDLATLKLRPRGFRVTTFHGHTGKRMWDRFVQVPTVRHASLLAHDVAAGGRAELLVWADTPKGTRLWLLDGASQRVLWGSRLR